MVVTFAGKNKDNNNADMDPVVSRSVIYQAGETANLPCDISVPGLNDELMLIMWYREDVRSPIYSIGKTSFHHIWLFIPIFGFKP